jgi:hypothetical protein
MKARDRLAPALCTPSLSPRRHLGDEGSEKRQVDSQRRRRASQGHHRSGHALVALDRDVRRQGGAHEEEGEAEVPGEDVALHVAELVPWEVLEEQQAREEGHLSVWCRFRQAGRTTVLRERRHHSPKELCRTS